MSNVMMFSRLELQFSKWDPCTCYSSITWKLVANANSRAPDSLNQNRLGWGPAICINKPSRGLERRFKFVLIWSHVIPTVAHGLGVLRELVREAEAKHHLPTPPPPIRIFI